MGFYVLHFIKKMNESCFLCEDAYAPSRGLKLVRQNCKNNSEEEDAYAPSRGLKHGVLVDTIEHVEKTHTLR